METIQLNIYKFSELPEEAKQSAIEKWREDNYKYDHHSYLIEEAHDSFKKFAEIFGISWRSMDYTENYRSEYSFHFEDDVLNMDPLRLQKWIWNNFKDQIFKGKYYGKLVDTFSGGEPIPKSKEHPIGKRHVKRYSKIFMDTSCVLTGVCYDMDLLQPIYDFLDKPNNNNIEDLMEDAINNICRTIQSEIDYRNSDEGIIEDIEANDYDFLESGEIYS